MLSRVFTWALVPVILAGCSPAMGDEELASPALGLAYDEIQAARKLAEKQIPADSSSDSKPVHIKTELLPQSQADSGKRQVLVVHYQYHGDLTYLTVLDLMTREVVKTDEHFHFPTALAPEEVQRAEALARRNLRAMAHLEAARHGGLAIETNSTDDRIVRMEAVPFQTIDASDPLFHHRVVEFQLVRDGFRLRMAPIRVDLTNETIHISPFFP